MSHRCPHLTRVNLKVVGEKSTRVTRVVYNSVRECANRCSDRSRCLRRERGSNSADGVGRDIISSRNPAVSHCRSHLPLNTTPPSHGTNNGVVLNQRSIDYELDNGPSDFRFLKIKTSQKQSLVCDVCLHRSQSLINTSA